MKMAFKFTQMLSAKLFSKITTQFALVTYRKVS